MVVIPLIFPKVPQSSLGILRVFGAAFHVVGFSALWLISGSTAKQGRLKSDPVRHQNTPCGTERWVGARVATKARKDSRAASVRATFAACWTFKMQALTSGWQPLVQRLQSTLQELEGRVLTGIYKATDFEELQYLKAVDARWHLNKASLRAHASATGSPFFAASGQTDAEFLSLANETLKNPTTGG